MQSIKHHATACQASKLNSDFEARDLTRCGDLPGAVKAGRGLRGRSCSFVAALEAPALVSEQLSGRSG